MPSAVHQMVPLWRLFGLPTKIVFGEWHQRAPDSVCKANSLFAFLVYLEHLRSPRPKDNLQNVTVIHQGTKEVNGRSLYGRWVGGVSLSLPLSLYVVIISERWMVFAVAVPLQSGGWACWRAMWKPLSCTAPLQLASNKDNRQRRQYLKPRRTRRAHWKVGDMF